MILLDVRLQTIDLETIDIRLKTNAYYKGTVMLIVHNFRELVVWQKSMALVKDTYLITNDFPNSEKFGLCAQIRRAVISISANIAEGCGRNSNKELIKFLGYALGSAYELETELILASNIGYISVETLESLIPQLAEIEKMILGLMIKISKES